MTRRESCLLALGAILPAGTCSARVPARDAGYGDYHSSLVKGLTPPYISWNGRKWRCAMGSVWNRGMEHSLRIRPGRARFEIRDTPLDQGPNDDKGKRRSELRSPGSPRLPIGVPLWGAMSFIHHRWEDPAGMASNWGGAHGQMHIGSSLGGSPAMAFRRTRKGDFAVTTRGEYALKNTRRYEGPLAFDRLHNLVYRLVLHPTRGELIVWLNGEPILDIKGVSIGSSEPECYWGFGCYYAGGVTCPIVAEYGDLVYPGVADLSRRIRFKPDWGARRG